ncbi:YkvA family protein [Methylotetracoccus oryzae]|uniref:YkvA family protein n=1 Tax=Methylotetracoccus oryzae TaxID=1919059 RepID=UPI001117BBEA|nr:YkvA family protein [Methylotetracoccus oryzae]
MSDSKAVVLSATRDGSAYFDFYQRLRARIRHSLARRKAPGPPASSAFGGLVEYLSTLPDLFHLGVSLLLDKSVPSENKGALIAALVYVMSPIDLIPDALPIAGWVDDLIVIIVALNKFLETEKPEVAAAVRRHWAGDQDVFELLKHLLAVGDGAIEFFPKRLTRMMRDMFR